MAKLSQQLGAAGEEAAVWFLQSIGARFIETVATPVRMVKGKAIFFAKSSVDFIAVLPGGKVSRIEVKLCDGNRLCHSVISKDQEKWLTEWSHDHFFSYILWVHKSNCYLFKYPHPLFYAGNSIDVETAKRIAYYKN